MENHRREDHVIIVRSQQPGIVFIAIDGELYQRLEVKANVSYTVLCDAATTEFTAKIDLDGIGPTFNMWMAEGDIVKISESNRLGTFRFREEWSLGGQINALFN